MTAYTYTPDEVCAPTTPAGEPRGADMGQMQVLLTEIVAQIEASVEGVIWKPAVDLATTSNITLSGEQTIDGTLTSASRVLVKSQTLPAQNGVYVTAAGAWTRATDADSEAELHRAGYYVLAGTANGGKQFACTTDTPITVGTTALTFVQIGDSGDSSLTKADVGLDQVDNTSDADKPVSTAQEARIAKTEIRAHLRPTLTYLAFIKVDRAAGTVSFPPMAIESDEVTAANTANTGNTFVSLALSTATGTKRYYYIDRADSNTIKTSTDPAYSASRGDVVALGWSENYAFQTLQGHRVRYVSDDLPNVRVMTRGNSSTVLGNETVIVDRAAGTVSFPSIRVWRAATNTAVVVSPPGWPTTPRVSLPLSTDFSVQVYYYVNLSTLVFGSTTTPDSPLASDDVLYIGSSQMGTFSSPYGLRVQYAQNDAPPKGIISAEGAARAAEVFAPPNSYSSRNGTLYAGTKWYAVQPVFNQDVLRVSAAGKIDLSYFPPNTSLTVKTFGSTVELWSGRGRNFLGQTDNRATIPANSVFTVRSIVGDVLIDPIIGTPAYGTITEPVMDRSILLAGQSQRQIYGTSGGIGGFMRALRDTTWLESEVDESINWINGATGGTAIDRRSVDISSDAYWWDSEANAGLGGPGPALDDCIAAITAATAAGQPAPDWVFWALGESDAVALAAGDLTVAQATESLTAVWEYIRANGATDAQFLISPVGANDFSSAPGYSGSRAAVLAAVEANSAWAHHGVEYYDMPRQFGQVHLFDIGYAAWGYREARAWANLEHSQTNDLGPTFGSVSLSTNKKVATITFTKEGPLYRPPGTISEGIVEGPYPFGIGIIPSGSSVTTATPIPGLRGYISSANLVIEADQSLEGATLIYPYGVFAAHRHAQFIRDYQYDQYHGIPGLPMRAFVSDPLA